MDGMTQELTMSNKGGDPDAQEETPSETNACLAVSQSPKDDLSTPAERSANDKCFRL